MPLLLHLKAEKRNVTTFPSAICTERTVSYYASYPGGVRVCVRFLGTCGRCRLSGAATGRRCEAVRREDGAVRGDSQRPSGNCRSHRTIASIHQCRCNLQENTESYIYIHTYIHTYRHTCRHTDGAVRGGSRRPSGNCCSHRTIASIHQCRCNLQENTESYIHTHIHTHIQTHGPSCERRFSTSVWKLSLS